jgi:hypothetical protein
VIHSIKIEAREDLNMNLYVGTSGYSYKEWKGSFYPVDLTSKLMLHYYGERFQTVEIKMPTTILRHSWNWLVMVVPSCTLSMIKFHPNLSRCVL